MNGWTISEMNSKETWLRELKFIASFYAVQLPHLLITLESLHPRLSITLTEKCPHAPADWLRLAETIGAGRAEECQHPKKTDRENEQLGFHASL